MYYKHHKKGLRKQVTIFTKPSFFPADLPRKRLKKLFRYLRVVGMEKFQHVAHRGRFLKCLKQIYYFGLVLKNGTQNLIHPTRLIKTII